MSTREQQPPSATIVAQRLSERGIRAAGLVAQMEAEHRAGVAPEARVLASWSLDHTPHSAAARAVVRGSRPGDAYEVSVQFEALGGGLWRQVSADCTCHDRWGRLWCGTCKHQLAFAAIAQRKLVCLYRASEPAPAEAIA